MLFGQDLGGRHERDLASAFDRLERGERSDDRLARADVALQQSLHRRRAFQVAADFGPNALLRTRQLERYAREQFGRQLAGARQHRRAPRRARFAMRLERELLREQLVDLEPCPRRMRSRFQRASRERRQFRRRLVQKIHGIGERPVITSPHEVVRDHFGGAARVDNERAGDDFAEHVLRKAGRRRVNRRQTIGERRAIRHDLELRVHDLEPVMTFAHFAEDPHAVASRQRLLVTRIEREETQYELRTSLSRRAILDQADELPARPILDVGANDDAFDLRGVTGPQFGERRQLRVIFVAKRQMQDEIFVPEDAEPDELCGERVARLCARLGRRCLSHCRFGAAAPTAAKRDCAAFLSLIGTNAPVRRTNILDH